jgi:uncharacterized protein (DUF433 family)/DNA-binding transcriptional MerR regulator
MAFPVPLTSALTGASVDQLAYWRRKTRSHSPLLVPSAQASGRFLYSWADVVALRSIVYLRQEKSLPRIRKAVTTLQQLEAEEWDHLAEYRLLRTAETIIVVTPRGEVLDLERAPGAVLHEILMSDVLAPFETDWGRKVPSLAHPRPRLSVDPEVLGGYPVVEGTRVPFDLVSSLADEGMPEAEIVELYPSVGAAAVADAQAFAKDVASAA